MKITDDDIEFTKECSHCAETGKKWIDKNGYQVAPDSWLLNDKKNKIKETKEVCPYCLGTMFEPTDIGHSILQLVKTYLNAKS